MSRPKGSKNKKTLLSESQLDDKIAAQVALKKKLEDEQQKIFIALEDTKLQLKNKKKELRNAEKNLEMLQEKKMQLEAEAESRAKKEEIENAVSTLLASGKGIDEILRLLRQ